MERVMKRCNSLTFSVSRGGLGGTNNPVDLSEHCWLKFALQRTFAVLLKVNPKLILMLERKKASQEKLVFYLVFFFLLITCFLSFFFSPHGASHRMQRPSLRPGIEPVPLHWKLRVLTTRPPGKFRNWVLKIKITKRRGVGQDGEGIKRYELLIYKINKL